MNLLVLRQLRTDLWQPPRPHGEIQRDRSVGALELFFDLVVVVLVAQAAHHLAGHLDAAGVGQFLIVFSLIWIAWFNGTLLHDLHGRDDARGRSNFLAQILLLVPLGAFVSDAGGRHGTAFAVDASLLFALLAVLWWLIGRTDQPIYRATTRRYVAYTLAAAVALGGSATLSTDARWIVWAATAACYLIACAVDFLRTPAHITSAAFAVTDALSERFGAFVIIVLGETVTGVVTGLSAGPTDPLRLAVGLIAVLIGFGSWWTYFDFAGHREVASAPRASVSWMLTHLPLTAAVAAMGAAMVRLVQDSGASRVAASTGAVLGGGALLLLVAMVGLVTTLTAWDEHSHLMRPIALACGLSGGLALAVGLLRPPPLLFVILLLACFMGPWIFAVLRRATFEIRAVEH